MSLNSPEMGASRRITLLVKPVIELPGLSQELTVPGLNVAHRKWKPMIDASNDGRERSVTTFYNRLTKKFTDSDVQAGTATESNQGKRISENEEQEILLGSSGLFREPVVIIHDHILPSHLATDIPSDYDILFFLRAESLSASLIIDRNGAHLLTRRRKHHADEPLTPSDLIEKVVIEATENDQTSTDVQKRIDSLISGFGLRYLYHQGLDANEDGAITFKKP